MKKILLIMAITTAMLLSQDLNTSKELSLQEKVQNAVNTYSQESNNTAVFLLVSKEGKTYKASSGLADRESKRKVKTDDLFEIGSATKVFTGIAVFQLIESGKLSLDTKINTLYPKGEITKLANYKGKNYWDEVTVGMLLQHTSGFIDYLNVYGDDAKAIKILGGKDKHYTFHQLISEAIKFGDANFKPGEKFKYCNTGFVILGDIISKVSGMDWHDYIQKNVLDKAGMNHTYFGSRIPKALREKMPKGYMVFKETFMAPSLADSAGEIISTLDDLVSLMRAWGTGKLYMHPETLELQLKKGFHQQSEGIENMTYGYAIMDIEDYYGHGGQTFGFQSYMTINLKNGDVYIVGVNDSTVGSMNLFMQLAGITYKKVSHK
jgi:D-alanyl-D-alanine carboxypeptidase